MISLRYDQIEKVGLQYVLDLLAPCSPYGRELVRNPPFYGPGERAALEREWYNITIALQAYRERGTEVTRLRHVFTQLRDIRPTLRRLPEGTLTEVELFEVKRFLLQLSLIVPLFRQLNMAFDGIAFTEETSALALLDPDGKHSMAYYVHAEAGSPLHAVRSEKSMVEQMLRAQDAGGERDRLLEKRRALVAREEEEAQKARQRLSAALRPYVDALLHNITMIGKLDFTLEKASLVRQRGGVMPCIVNSGLRFDDMAHPRLEDALVERGGFTRVSIDAPEGACVITGANMGGKSVAIRTLTLQVLLCHAGFFAFASRAEVSLFDAVHLICEELESEAAGVSSFGAEVLRMQQMLMDIQNGVRCFVAMDEPARGTNPEEGAALVRALTRKLSGAHAVAVIATHYDGAADAARAHYRAAGFRNLPDVLPADGGINFIARHMNYGLVRVDGESKTPRDALTVCRLLGLDGEVLSDMADTLQKHDQSLSARHGCN